MKGNPKSATIHPIVGRQRRLGTGSLSGSLESQTSRKAWVTSPSKWGPWEWVPSSESAVARSPCPSEAGWRATDERQRRYPTVPLLVRSGASVRWPGLPADTLSPPATWRTSYTGSAGQRPRSLSSSTQCLSLMFQRCASSVQICGPNAKPFRP